MSNAILASGLTPWAIALLVLTIGVTLAVRRRRSATRARRLAWTAASGLCMIVAVAMLLGAAAAAYRNHEIAGLQPNDGRLVDVGGYSAFVRCVGPHSGVTVVLLTGGYSTGLRMQPLQARLDNDYRVCTVDRPGTGWADDAPLPRTVDTVIRELHDALRGAGESGPLVLVGHSMGGLYAANFAQAFPADVAGLVLLDPTPPLWFVESDDGRCLRPTPPASLAFPAMFGMGLIRTINPLFDKPEEAKLYGPNYPIIADQEIRPRTLVAAWSALSEAGCAPLSLVRTRGSLGTLPLLLIVQALKSDAQWLKEAPPGLTPRQRTNFLRLRHSWVDEYVGYTSRGRTEFAPAGADHAFPYTHLEFTSARIRSFLIQNPDWGRSSH